MSKAKSKFRLAVETSGFSRVCPKCLAQWSDELKFIRENRRTGELRQTRYKAIKNVIDSGGVMREVEYSGVLTHEIYQHECGGEMLLDVGR